MYKLALIALFIAVASANPPLVAHAPLIAHAPLPLATSYSNSWRVSHSVVPAPVHVAHAPVPVAHAPLVAHAPAWRAVAPLAHAPLVAPAHAPISIGHAAPLAHGWPHLG